MRVLVLALVGCAPPSDEVLEWGDLDGTALLVDQPRDAFAERVQPIGVPRARLLPDGPDLHLEGRAEQGTLWNGELGELVVVDPTPWPRVAVHTRGLQVLVYVERDALEPRVVALVDGTGPDGDGLVRLRPGVPVERIDEDADRVRVFAELAPLAVEVWLPRHAVDEVFTSERRRTALGPALEGTRRALIGGASVLDRPGGDVLAVLDEAAGAFPVRVTGDGEHGYVSVVLESGDVWLRGHVHEDDLTDELRVPLACGCGTGSGSTWGSSSCGWGLSATVPAGTLLRAGPGGPVVARATVDLPVDEEARFDGARLVRHTQLGTVVVWADPADVR